MILLAFIAFVLIFMWPLVLAIVIIIIAWMLWPERKIPCTACSKKFRTNAGLKKHVEKCGAYQSRIKENYRKEHERKREERKRQEEQWQREEEERKRGEEFHKKHREWKENWRNKKNWKFTEEEFWKIQNDIDERKDDATKDLEDERDRATEKLWDKFWATDSDSLQDRIQDKIDEIDDMFDEKIEEIEEEFEEEEEVLWNQVWGYDWYEPSGKQRRARENYEKAKQDYKKKTGRQWHDDDWEKNWYEAFEDLLGERVDLDECYKILGLSKGVEFSQVKKRYRELALKHHPDKCQDKEEAERKFKEIVNAYEAIRNSMEEMTA